MPSSTIVPLVMATSTTWEPHAEPLVEMSTPWSSVQVLDASTSESGRKGNTRPPMAPVVRSPGPMRPAFSYFFSSRRTSASDGAPLAMVFVAEALGRRSGPPTFPLTEASFVPPFTGDGAF